MKTTGTLIRFCRLIGCEGLTQSTGKFMQTDPQIQFQAITYQNMLSVFSNSPEDFSSVAEIITQSQHKYIIGLMGCREIALTFSRALSFMLTNVSAPLIPSEKDLISVASGLFVLHTRVYCVYCFKCHKTLGVKELELLLVDTLPVPAPHNAHL